MLICQLITSNAIVNGYSGENSMNLNMIVILKWFAEYVNPMKQFRHVSIFRWTIFCNKL